LGWLEIADEVNEDVGFVPNLLDVIIDLGGLRVFD
jgi:hypothetical protein